MTRPINPDEWSCNHDEGALPNTGDREKQIAAKKKEIAVRYAPKSPPLKKKEKLLLWMRVSEIERLALARTIENPSKAAETSANLAFALAHHTVANWGSEKDQNGRTLSALIDGILTTLPTTTNTDATRAANSAFNAQRPRRWTSASLGQFLAVTKEERTALRLTTIRWAGCEDTSVADERRERDRIRKAEKRRSMGMRSKDEMRSEESEAAEAMRTLARSLGKSLSTAYRMVASGRIPAPKMARRPHAD